MSIRPVDYQILMPKVNEVAKNQNAEQQRMMGQIQQQAENSTKKADQDTRTVHSQKETQHAVITDEQKRRNSRGSKKEGKEEKEKQESRPEKNRSATMEKRTIDIRI